MDITTVAAAAGIAATMVGAIAGLVKILPDLLGSRESRMEKLARLAYEDVDRQRAEAQRCRDELDRARSENDDLRRRLDDTIARADQAQAALQRSEMHLETIRRLREENLEELATVRRLMRERGLAVPGDDH